jgi:hypothetical protein
MVKKSRRLLLIIVALCAMSVSVWAEDPPNLFLNLANMPPDEVQTRTCGRDTAYSGLTFNNVIPRFWPYDIDIATEDVGIDPLEFDAAKPRALSIVLERQDRADCKRSIAALEDALDKVEKEKDVPDIGAAAKAAASIECKEEVWERFIELTQRTLTETISVRSNQTLTVTVSRPGVVFTFECVGKARGEWRTSYGFFFVPDRDDRYYVKETSTAKPATTTDPATPAKFTIFEQEDREEFDFVPTVVFTFFPRGAGETDGVRGWTAGLGYDLEKPFVFGGYSYAYNENVIFTGGIAFHRQSRLLGKYKGDVEGEVTQVLEPSQLVDDTYGPNVYIGISFRFGEDIHARRKALEEATTAKKAADAAARTKAKAAEDESNLRKAECIARAEGAAAKAKEAKDCRDDALCIARVEKEEAAAKVKCALTELERVKAEAEVTKKADVVACKENAKKANDGEVAKCKKTLDDCKKNADAAGVKKCEEAATACNKAATDALTKANADCEK